MVEVAEGTTAFSKFRALDGDTHANERDQLFRSMAQLFAHVSERCDDEQVAQYDEVLCQLADLVEAEARSHVAGLLARLDRAPGSVVVKLAHDTIDVARPLLEFSSVLSDDDLIEIVHDTDEDHRVVIADRERVGARVGDAIVEQGGNESVVRLVNNKTAQLAEETVGKLLSRAEQNDTLVASLRGRTDIDWKAISSQVGSTGGKVLEQMGLGENKEGTLGTVSAVVYNRLRNTAGFSSQEWKVAWSQVKGLADRKKLDHAALARFARFAYGHHAAAGLTVLFKISPDVMVKWLASQDFVAFTVACRAHGLDGDLFKQIVSILPWRELPQDQDVKDVRARFDAIRVEEATEIFDLWRSHSFRKRTAPDQKINGAA